MTALDSPILGQWRIVESDKWDREHLDSAEPASLVIETHERGEIAVGSMQARLAIEHDSGKTIFAWSGSDEEREVSGSGLMEILDGGLLKVELQYRLGGEVVLKAVREPDSTSGHVKAVRRWLAEARARAGEQGEQDGAEEAGDPAEAILSAHRDGGEAWPDPPQLAAALLATSILWRPESCAHLPARAIRALADEGGASGQALGLLAQLTSDPSNVQAAVALKNLVISDAIACAPDALALIVNAVSAEPGELQHLANHLFHHGDQQVAAELCRRIIMGGRAYRDTYLVLSLAEAACGSDPRPFLDLGLLHFPDDHVLLIQAAKAHLDAGESAVAAELALRAGALAAGEVGTLAATLEVLFVAQRFGDVIAVANRSALDQPRHVPLLATASVAALQAGQYSTSLRFARRCLSLDAGYAGLDHVLMAACARLWRYLGARDLALTVLQARPDAGLWRSFVHHRLRLLEATPPSIGKREAVEDCAFWALTVWDKIEGDLRVRIFELAASSQLDEVAASLVRRFTEDLEPLAVHECLSIARAAGVEVPTPPAQTWTAEALSAFLQDTAARPRVGAASHVPRTLRLLAASLDPESPTARLNAGLAELAGGELREAENHFRAVIEGGNVPSGRVLWPVSGPDGAWPRARLGGWESYFRERCGGAPWPRITLVTPSLNQGRFLEDAILSVLNQNYPELQYIVVDAGSTDETPKILERYRDRISRVLVREGMGQSEALNLGFSDASGELLGWLNTDDVLMPGALHAMAAASLETKADVLVGDCLIFRDRSVENLIVSDRRADKLHEAELLDIYGSWLSGGFFCQPEVMVARAAFERIGGRLENDLDFTMDFDLWIRLARSGASRASVAWPVAGFRKHPDQKTAREFACFSELRGVRERHGGCLERASGVALPIPAIVGRNRAAELCVWDARPLTPLSIAVGREFKAASGRTVRLVEPAASEADTGVRLHLLGLGGPLPEPGEVRDRLGDRDLPSFAWIWNAAAAFVGKRKLSELFDLVVPADSAAGGYLSNRSAAFPALPQGATLLASEEVCDGFELRTARSERLCGFVTEEGHAPMRLPSGWEAVARSGSARLEAVSLDMLAAASGGDPRTYLDCLGRYDTLLVPSITGELPFIVFDAILAGARPLLVVDDVAAGSPPAGEPDVPSIRLRDADALADIVASRSVERAREDPRSADARCKVVRAKHTVLHRVDQFLARLEGAPAA